MAGDQFARGDGVTQTVDQPLHSDKPRRTPDESTVGLGPAQVTGAGPDDAGTACSLQPGEILAGRFAVVRFIARGGMGAVYEGDDVVLHTRVALKVLERNLVADTGAMERFQREVLLARTVSHPNVCRVYEFYEATTAAGLPVHFLTMEFLEGETLSSRIRRNGPFSTPDALPLVRQMCEGLAAAHAEGVIHRDFKSANVILVPRAEPGEEGERVAITDFGIARALRKPKVPGAQALTGETGFIGTPEYMAPEQVTGSDVSPATDLYALGVVLYEMVTGQLPFSGDTPLAIAVRHVEQAPPRPEVAAPGLNPRWSRTILRCLDREPSRRFQHAPDIVAALTRGSLRTRWWLRALAMLGALSVGVASAVVVREWRVDPRATSVKAAATAPSVAVLPFLDMSPQHDQEYLSEGVAEEIIGALAEVPGLHVVARSSSFSFKGKNEDVRSVGEKLNVAHVLEGSVRKSGGRLRVTAQLVNTADGYQLWSQTFERETGDIFAVQDEVARAVVNTLRVKGLPEWRRSSPGRGTSPGAYAAYLRGLQFSRIGDHRKAIDEFRTAIGLDPNYAPAHASFAKSLLFFGFYAASNELFDNAWRRHALDAAEKAVALDPGLPDAYVARGIARHDAWDWPGALSDFEEALALAPSSADALGWRSAVLGNIGRAADALADARLAVSIDPLSAQAHYVLGYEQMSIGQYSDARASFERSFALAPGFIDVTLHLGHVELLTGHPAKALAVYETAPQESAKLTGFALAQHSLGNEAASREALAQLIAKYSASSQYQIAEAYAWRGEREQALQWLERAYVERDPGIPGILTDPFFRSLNDDPRFAALVAKMKLPPTR